MGMLVDGKWVSVPVSRGTKDDDSGRFQRKPSSFRERIARGGAHPPVAGRYHLYVSWACPWAHRTLIVRRLRGLDDAISISVVDYLMGEDGWVFSDRPGATPDSVNGTTHLRDVYVLADPHYTGKVTVPVLWDKETKTIVNNESRDIIEMLDSEFGAPLFYPEPLRAEIDAMIDANYETVNNGVYKAGFATRQTYYEAAVGELFARLAVLEERLGKQRYLVGDRITLADWCLFTTLLRFDAVYHGHFKCNLRTLASQPNLSGYLRDLYQQPGVAELCNFEHIKGHYYQSHKNLNPSGIVPLGPEQDLTSAHGRDRLR